MKEFNWTKKCKGCGDQFFAQTTSTVMCWKCSGKSTFPTSKYKRYLKKLREVI